ncbi:histone-lysine N-methyltransferase 2D-like [Ylistrum balloti]|uniref:histone-lysine N-methyltransferase 2D-like n=1 Tax=Ylistrum balloti TaxID=509963 RepID=UPI002905F646|nr:histone-lysine N-methyltransferase 2D-like [Ylistrum balloti]
MSENNTLHCGWLERITKDTKGKEKREHLWSVLKRNGYIFFFTDQREHTGETHTGKLPINSNTVFTRREKEEKKYGGYVFTIFARDRNIESNVKFKTAKKSAMEEWRGFISIVSKDSIPPDLDLPTDYIQEMEFILGGLKRCPKEPDGHLSARTDLSRDSGIPHDSVSRVTSITKRTSASEGSGGSGGSSTFSTNGRSGKTIISQRHKFSNNPLGDDVYPSWFVPNCSREKALSIFTKVGTTYGNTLMRESAQAASHGTYVISYCSKIKDRAPVCDHFKVLRTVGGFRIDVDTTHPDMSNLTDVMMFFIKLNGSDRTQTLTTNDFNLLGQADSDYTTYLPKNVDQHPGESAVAAKTRDRKISEPPPDYDYEAPVSTRPKTVTGATLQNEMKKYNAEHARAKEPARSNRHLHYEKTGSHTVAPMRRVARSELPPGVRNSMPDPRQLNKIPRTAVSWQGDPNFHTKVVTPPKQREQTPPPPCAVNSPLGYENDKPGFDQVISRHTMDDSSSEIPPPNYKAPAPPPVMLSVVSGKTMGMHSPELPQPDQLAPPPPQSSSKGIPSKAPPSFKAPQSPPARNDTEERPVPASGIPAPPPPPPPPPVIGPGGSPSKSPDTKSNAIQVTGRKGRLSSADDDDVAHKIPNLRRPTAPHIWRLPDQNERSKQMRSQSVPNLEDHLKNVKLRPKPQSPLDIRVSTSMIQRHPPKSVPPKSSASFDSGSYRAEAKPVESEIDDSRPGGVGTLTRKFGEIEFAKRKIADSPPVHTSRNVSSAIGQLYVNEVKEEKYRNDQMDDSYVNVAVSDVTRIPGFHEPSQYVNTQQEFPVKIRNDTTTNCVDTSGNPSVQALKKKLDLEKVLGSPGLPKVSPKVTSPEVRNKRDIPLPAIPVETAEDTKDEIYDIVG